MGLILGVRRWKDATVIRSIIDEGDDFLGFSLKGSEVTHEQRLMAAKMIGNYYKYVTEPSLVENSQRLMMKVATAKTTRDLKNIMEDALTLYENSFRC